MSLAVLIETKGSMWNEEGRQQSVQTLKG